jgi:hypothetical protein
LLSDQPEKTETMTFRLPLSIVKSLKNDAEFEKVSVNSLAIRIFSDHISWEKYERKVGLLPMTKVFLENAVAKMTETRSGKPCGKKRERLFQKHFNFHETRA